MKLMNLGLNKGRGWFFKNFMGSSNFSYKEMYFLPIIS